MVLAHISNPKQPAKAVGTIGYKIPLWRMQKSTLDTSAGRRLLRLVQSTACCTAYRQLTCWVATCGRPADEAERVGWNMFCCSGACWGAQEGALGTGAGWAAGGCQAGWAWAAGGPAAAGAAWGCQAGLGGCGAACKQEHGTS